LKIWVLWGICGWIAAGPTAAKHAIVLVSWFAFYNGRRPRQALGNRTPMAVWRSADTDELATRLWT
jgi:hypothetical protein